MTKNILLSGVGGQGTITAAKMLTFGLMEAGYDVKMSEIHGMSQRGGDVVSQVRYSKDKVFSPVIEKGTADIVVSFEEMEALRTLEYLKPDGAVVVNTERIPSMTVLTGAEEYADDIIEEIKTICWCGRKATYNTRFDENGVVVKEGEQVVLGANDKYIGLCRRHWKEGNLGPGWKKP